MSIHIDPQRVRQEGEAWQQRVTQALDALSRVRHVDTGASPRDAVYREDKLTLYRYRPLSPGGRSTGPAVLICYALVNRPYMLDLQPDRSLIRGLLSRGIDVFLIDWGYPDGADRYLDMDDYVNRYIRHCVERVCELRGEERTNLLGVCQGGTLSLCHVALHPERIRTLIAIVTPVDFQTPDDLLSRWVRSLDVDALVRAMGNIPGEFLNAAFLALMPFRLLSQKYAGMLDIVHDPDQLQNFLRMEKWIFDSPDQPGELFRQFVTGLYQQNRLKAGTLEIAGSTVALRRISCPVLNVYATQDHLVPPPASLCLGELIGSQDYGVHAFRGGHVGIYVSARAQTEIPDTIAGWLQQRQ